MVGYESMVRILLSKEVSPDSAEEIFLHSMLHGFSLPYWYSEFLPLTAKLCEKNKSASLLLMSLATTLILETYCVGRLWERLLGFVRTFLLSCDATSSFSTVPRSRVVSYTWKIQWDNLRFHSLSCLLARLRLHVRIETLLQRMSRILVGTTNVGLLGLALSGLFE